MNITKAKVISAIVGAAIALLLTTVTGCAKFLEPFNDAPVSQHDNLPAVVGNMPDGFSNWASKCDLHGHRVFTTYHGDKAYGAIAVINDTACK